MLTIQSPIGEVVSIKYHREGSGSDPNNVAMDIKVKCECMGPEVLNPLLGGGDESDASVFWVGEKKALAFPHLNGLNDIGTKIEGCKAVIEKIELTHCNLGVFKFKPKMGGVIALSFNISAKQVTPKQQDQIRGLLKTDVKLLVEGGDIITTASASKDDEGGDADDQEGFDL